MGSARAKGQYTMQTWIIKWFTDKPSLTLGSRCTNIGGIYPGRHVWSLYFPCVGALLSFYFPNHYLGPQSLTEPQLQSRHPYAAMPSLPSLPFAALGAGHQLGKRPSNSFRVDEESEARERSVQPRSRGRRRDEKAVFLWKHWCRYSWRNEWDKSRDGNVWVGGQGGGVEDAYRNVLRMIYWMLLKTAIGSRFF